MRRASFKPFWPLALVQQALPAIILAALRRSRGPALFPGPHPSLSLGAPFWPSGLTIRRSRPPTAAAELRALVPSPALCAQPLISALGPVPKAFKPFGPPALASQAPPAILLAALRRFRGPALFRGLRPGPSPGAPFWPSGLTLQSSGPAFCGPLTLAVRCSCFEHCVCNTVCIFGNPGCKFHRLKISCNT